MQEAWLALGIAGIAAFGSAVAWAVAARGEPTAITAPESRSDAGRVRQPTMGWLAIELLLLAWAVSAGDQLWRGNAGWAIGGLAVLVVVEAWRAGGVGDAGFSRDASAERARKASP